MRGTCIGVWVISLSAMTMAQKTVSSLSGMLKNIAENQSHLLFSSSLLNKGDELIGLWDPGLRPCESNDDKENVFMSLIQHPRFIMSPISQKQNEECHHINARYSGTDLKGGVLEEKYATNASDCQSRCYNHSKCKYFLFFTNSHHQRFKHNICRLLQYSGKLEKDLIGHVSGPKACIALEVENKINSICLRLKELSLNGSESSQKLSCSRLQLNKDIELLIPGIVQNVSSLFVDVILDRYCNKSEGLFKQKNQIVPDQTPIERNNFVIQPAIVLKDGFLIETDDPKDISPIILVSQRDISSNEPLVSSTDITTIKNPQIIMSTEPLEKDFSLKEQSESLQVKDTGTTKGTSETSTTPIPIFESSEVNKNDGKNHLNSEKTSLDVKLDKDKSVPIYDDYLYYDYYENDATESILTPPNNQDSTFSTLPNVNLLEKETANPNLKENEATSKLDASGSENLETTTSFFIINDFNLGSVARTEAPTKFFEMTESILKETEINLNTESSLSESDIDKSTIRSLFKEIEGTNVQSVDRTEGSTKDSEITESPLKDTQVDSNSILPSSALDSTTISSINEFNPLESTMITPKETSLSGEGINDNNYQSIEPMAQSLGLPNMSPISPSLESMPDKSTTVSFIKLQTLVSTENPFKETETPKKKMNVQSTESTPQGTNLNLNSIPSSSESGRNQFTTISSINDINSFNIQSLTRVGDASRPKKGDRVQLVNDRNDLRPVSSSSLSNGREGKKAKESSSKNSVPTESIISVTTTDRSKSQNQNMKMITEKTKKQMTGHLGNEDTDHSSSTSTPSRLSMVGELTVNRDTESLNSPDITSDFPTMNPKDVTHSNKGLLLLLDPPSRETITLDPGNMELSKSSSMTTPPSTLTPDNQEMEALTQVRTNTQVDLESSNLRSSKTITNDKIIFPSTELLKSSRSSKSSNESVKTKILTLREKDLPLFLRILTNHLNSKDEEEKEANIRKEVPLEIVEPSEDPQTTTQSPKKKIYIYPKIIQLYPNENYEPEALWLRFYSRRI